MCTQLYFHLKKLTYKSINSWCRDIILENISTSKRNKFEFGNQLYLERKKKIMNEIKRVGYGSMRAKAYMKEETTTTTRSYCSFGSLLSDEKYKMKENL